MLFGHRFPRASPLVAGILLLTACTAENDSAPHEGQANENKPSFAPGRAGQTFVYECKNESRIVVRVEDEKAWLFLRSGTVSLPQVQSLSGVDSSDGAVYSDGAITYRGKGEDASIERPEHARVECTNNRVEAIWEDAKLRGADFRGTGNEPGWYLEISKAYGIVYVTNYGSDRYHFEEFDADSDDASGSTVFEASKGGHELTILLEGRPCMDSMSGAEFATKVTVSLDGESWNGCGKALH
jgi:uncharacterized membrane protein